MMKAIRKVLKRSKYPMVFAAMLLFLNCKSYREPADTDTIAAEALQDNLEIPEYWEASQDTSVVAADWYRNFDDPYLESLIEEAIDTTNLSIVYQLALVEQSRAQRELAESDKRVKVGYGVDAAGLAATGDENTYVAGIGGGISWEADLWGKIETGILAADENLKASVYNYNFTRQSIAATTARLYFEIGTLNRELQIGHDFIEVNEHIMDLLRIREEVGAIDMKELFLIRAQISSINNLIEEYKNQLQIKTRDLEVVLGRYPENKLEVNWTPQQIEPIHQIGRPFDLINRRPDIKRDESRVRSRFYLTEQAKLLKYPNLVLSADMGFSTVSDLIFGAGGSFFGPIYTGGAIESQIASATATQKKALMTYGLSILNAFNEVETAMTSEKILLEQQRYITTSIDESKNAYDLMLKQYAVGRVGLFEVLQTQMDWLLRELDLVNVNGDIFVQRVQLYLALGGDITYQDDVNRFE